MSQWLLFLSLLLSILCFLYHLLSTSRSKKKSMPLPPGPNGVPILGCIPLLGPLPHRSLRDYSKIYGPLMHLRIGSIPTIVVSSPEVAEQFLKTHDATFANRPPSEIMRCISYGHRGFGFTEYGQYWRDVRKLCVTNLLSASKIGSFRSIRAEEIGLFVQSLRDAARAREEVNIRVALADVVADIVTRMLLGKKWNNKEDDAMMRFRTSTADLFMLLGKFNLNDAVPVARIFDFQRMRKKAREMHQVQDAFLEEVIDEHLREGREKEGVKDFVDILLSLMENEEKVDGVRIDRTTVKAIVLDMLDASLDTMRGSIEWTLSELLKNPRIMRKLKEELAAVIGARQQIEESDLSKLEYLHMVQKESFRLHPLFGFLFHHGKEECEVRGYRIPRGANVFVNLWAIGRDPSIWTNAEEFIPERFIDNHVDIAGHDFRLLSFGSGRRVCAGMQFALIVVPLILAHMVHCFDWELPEGVSASDLDMAEINYAFTMPRAKPLVAIPTECKASSINVHLR